MSQTPDELARGLAELYATIDGRGAQYWRDYIAKACDFIIAYDYMESAKKPRRPTMLRQVIPIRAMRGATGS